MRRIFNYWRESRAQRQTWDTVCRAVDIVIAAPWESRLQSQLLLFSIRDVLEHYRPSDSATLLADLLRLCDGQSLLELPMLLQFNCDEGFWQWCRDHLSEPIRTNLETRCRLPDADGYSIGST